MSARYIIPEPVLNKIYHFGLRQTALEVTALDILISLLCGRFFRGWSWSQPALCCVKKSKLLAFFAHKRSVRSVSAFGRFCRSFALTSHTMEMITVMSMSLEAAWIRIAARHGYTQKLTPTRVHCYLYNDTHRMANFFCVGCSPCPRSHSYPIISRSSVQRLSFRERRNRRYRKKVLALDGIYILCIQSIYQCLVVNLIFLIRCMLCFLALIGEQVRALVHVLPDIIFLSK